MRLSFSLQTVRFFAATGAALVFALASLTFSAAQVRPKQTKRSPILSAPIRFAREIQPILSDRCFRCHGPDARARKADLRLDTEAGVKRVFVPGKPKQSAAF